jgi:hypothetical protein
MWMMTKENAKDNFKKLQVKHIIAKCGTFFITWTDIPTQYVNVKRNIFL